MRNENLTFLFQPKHGVGTQKNRLNQTGFFEHPKHMFKLMGKQYLHFNAENFCLSKPVNEFR